MKKLVLPTTAVIASLFLVAAMVPSGGAEELQLEGFSKTVGIPKADVVFAFDLTGSMSLELEEVKDNAESIMNDLASQIADVQFGVVSFMDYDGHYETEAPGSTPLWYNNTYGSAASGDYPYMLDLDLTADTVVTAATINGLVLGNGVDGPEDYTRIVHEVYNDANLHWRDGAERIVILFGDNVPHDTNFDYNDDGTPDNTGADPGRDAILATADDLDFETEVANAAAAGIHIMAVYSGFEATKYPWTYMADETDGGYFALGDASDIPSAITQLIQEKIEESLTISVGTENSWAMVFEFTNPYDYELEDVVITDRFGAELEIDELGTPTHGTAEYYTRGNSEKVFLEWDIGTLGPEETARLVVVVSTDLNPAGHQEYTSPGVYELNSGATLKFYDSMLDEKMSAVTDSIYVTVLP